MNNEQRMEASGLITEIINPKEVFFKAASARRLIEIIPSHKPPIFSLQYIFWSKSQPFTGYAPGIGNVSVQDDEPQKEEWSYNQPIELSVGLYKITHTPGHMEISHMFADTYEDDTGQRCLLQYSRKTGEPFALKNWVRNPTWILGRIKISLSTKCWKDWKTPAPEPQTSQSLDI